MNKKLIWTLGILSVTTLFGVSVYNRGNASAQDLTFPNLNGTDTNRTSQFDQTRSGSFNETKMELDELKRRVNSFINGIDENLEVADIFVYENSDYYFSIEETDTGKGAMELLVNPYTGEIYPEYGPNMMWNEKYDLMHGDYGTIGGRYGHMGGSRGMMGGSRGHMGGSYGRTGAYSGMMGGSYGGTNEYSGNTDETYNGYPGMMDRYYENDSDYATQISRTDALGLANDYVKTVNPNLVVPNEGHEFYGYYTFHIEDEAGVTGMMSVNMYTGDVWYHNWHGTIVEIISHHDEDHNNEL